jgi:hypothetical protein
MAGAVTISGLSELLRDIDKLEVKTKALIQAELKASAQIIVRNAKREAAKDMGALAGGVNYKEVNPTLYELFSQMEYSAFVEFGTRRRRKIPPEVQKLGIRISYQKQTGTAEQALMFITAWVKRKGIKFGSAATFKSGKKKGQNKQLTVEQTAWFIFLHIMRTGIKPKPFFFPALLAEAPQLQKRLELIINNARA